MEAAGVDKADKAVVAGEGNRDLVETMRSKTCFKVGLCPVVRPERRRRFRIRVAVETAVRVEMAAVADNKDKAARAMRHNSWRTHSEGAAIR